MVLERTKSILIFENIVMVNVNSVVCIYIKSIFSHKYLSAFEDFGRVCEDV